MSPSAGTDPKKLERLCRYISRPAVSEKRLSLTRG
ncbi:transposase, partial [Escherichia coli]